MSPPYSSGTHVLCKCPVCLVEDLAVFTPRRHTGRDAGEGEEEKHKREGQRGGWRGEGKGRDTEHSKLGLIYFINRDYKFNLQTRGQNFSLTRGPWRTSGLGDHSYY